MVHTHNPALVRSKQKNQKFKALPSSFLVSSRMSRIQRPCLNGGGGGGTDRQRGRKRSTLNIKTPFTVC